MPSGIFTLTLEAFAYPAVTVTTSAVRSKVRVEVTLLVGVIAEVPSGLTWVRRTRVFGDI